MHLSVWSHLGEKKRGEIWFLKIHATLSCKLRWWAIGVLDLKSNPVRPCGFGGLCIQWPSRERSDASLAAQLQFDPWDKESHIIPLESENPLSSSPSTHQICQSKPAALSRMGQPRRLSFKKSCQLYLPSVWRKKSLSKTKEWALKVN